AAISLEVGAELSRIVGDGTYQPGNVLAVDSSATLPVVGDFNGDSLADFAYFDSDGTSPVHRIYFGNGDGTFQDPVTLSSGTRVREPGDAADIDGDGDLDLFAAFATGEFK